MKRKIILTLLACITTVYIYGQATETKPKPVEQLINKLQLQNEIFYPIVVFANPESKVEAGIGPYTELKIDNQKLKAAFEANYKSIRLMIPAGNNKTIAVLLTQHDLYGSDFELSITDEYGKHTSPINKGRYYFGHVENETNTLAAISIYENEIGGVISNNEGNWNLGKLEKFTDKYGYYNDADFKLPITFNCETKDFESNNAKGGGGNQTFTTKYEGNCAKIFFDCSFSYYQNKGSNTTNVTNYTNSLFNVISTIYYNDSISLGISAIHIWTVVDPFDHSSGGNALNTFRTYYTTNTYPGSIAALLSTSIGGGGGVAYVDQVCSQQWGYGISGIDGSGINNFPTYTWDVNLVAHECGHTLGSPHTHWCGWVGGPIDNCNVCWGITTDGGCANGPAPPNNGGTIMSYCHGCTQGVNFVNGFGFQPSSRIRNSIANAGCVNVCTSCNTNLTLSGTHLSTEQQSWWATNEIIGVNVLQQSGSYLNFNAGVDVILQPNFEVLAGATFHASVGCTPVALPPVIINNAKALAIKESVLGNDLVVSPNPFSNQLRVAFELNDAAMVTASIIDQTGREIQQTVLNQQMEKGRQEVNMNTNNISAGIYFLVVSINNVKYTRKIIKM
nr:T9SS type A sorting domain-containing protein [Bacteroidota bacterium]